MGDRTDGAGNERHHGPQGSDGGKSTTPPRPRICCCLRPGDDRRLLVKWLENHGYEPIAAAPEELEDVEFDCILIDGPSLRTAEGTLRAVRAADGGIRPCLLVAPGDASEALTGLPSETATVVTDVLGTPLRSVVLRRRLESALSINRLSTALAGSRERYRGVIERTPAAVFLISEGSVVYSNEAAERLLGRSATGIDGTQFLAFLTEPDRERIGSLLDGLSSGEETDFVEASFVGSNRSVPVELAATSLDDPSDPTNPDPAIGTSPAFGTSPAIPAADVQVVAHDVSRRKAREEQLRLYRRAMDAATVGITISNPALPDNPLVYVNEEFERLTGRSREDTLGRNARILQCSDTDPGTVTTLREAIAAGESVSVELLNERADGSRWYNALDVTPIHGPDGTVEYFLGFQRDVTDRREREIRLAVLDRVLRHNLRNRLNVVLGHVAELEDGIHEDGEDGSEGDAGGTDDVGLHAERIRTAAESLLSLSDAARRFRTILKGKGDGNDDSPIRLDREIVDALETVRSSHPDARIGTMLEPVTIRGGAGWTVAVEELVMNAIDHCDRRPEITVTVRHDGGEAVVTVADNGPGIPALERPALIGDEETPIEHASGLGLWLVRWIVDDADGSVSYADNEPRGAVVTLRLPLVEEDRDAA